MPVTLGHALRAHFSSARYRGTFPNHMDTALRDLVTRLHVGDQCPVCRRSAEPVKVALHKHCAAPECSWLVCPERYGGCTRLFDPDTGQVGEP